VLVTPQLVEVDDDDEPLLTEYIIEYDEIDWW